jgi:LysM repeat protein
MNNLLKILVVVSLAIGVFGGGGFTAYRLFFKRPNSHSANANQPVITPTPDPGIEMIAQAKQDLAAGHQTDGEDILRSLIRSFPDSIKSDEAKKMLGDLNISAFFSPAPGPNKTDYIVVRGDSIAKIANKTKTSAELIFKANNLESLTIQPGERIIIPKGQFSMTINAKNGEVTLLNNGDYFRWYKPLEFKLTSKPGVSQCKMKEKIAWSNGVRVAFGEKKYLGSSRWIVISDNAITLYSETNLETPNAQKPAAGIMLSPPDMEELYALVTKETPIIVKQ